MVNLNDYIILVCNVNYGDHGHFDRYEREGFNTLEEAEAYLNANKNAQFTGCWQICLRQRSDFVKGSKNNP